MRALFFPSILDATAHIAAGSQPINVHCKMRHTKPVKIRPLKKKDNPGKKNSD